jgi:hypothetical protein
MRKPRSLFPMVMVVTSLFIPMAGLAQTEQDRKATSSSQRLFQAFIEDATIVDNQWWEAQIVYEDLNLLDRLVLRGIAAFQPWKDLELGARVGFGRSDANYGLSEGTGATDLNVWGKYYLGKVGDATEFTVGALVTIPTGDDAAGLGQDAFNIAAFGAMRHRFDLFVLSAHLGVRANGDGQQFSGDDLIEFDGETSPIAGVGLLYPFSDTVTFVGEFNFEGARFEGDRFEGSDTDVRALGGVNWRISNRGILRSALSIGLTDGASDFQLILGYAFDF